MARRKKNKYDKMQFGFWPGLLFPLIVFFVVYLVKNDGQTFSKYVESLWTFNILIKLLTLCVVPNLAYFLFLTRKKYDMAARGVLMATFVYAFVVVFSKLI